MARSHAVWVVTSELFPWPLTACTVKHELKTWLSRTDAEARTWMHVWRLADGRNAMHWEGGKLIAEKAKEVDIDEILSG